MKTRELYRTSGKMAVIPAPQLMVACPSTREVSLLQGLALPPHEDYEPFPLALVTPIQEMTQCMTRVHTHTLYPYQQGSAWDRRLLVGVAVLGRAFHMVPGRMNGTRNSLQRARVSETWIMQYVSVSGLTQVAPGPMLRCCFPWREPAVLD
ncbi:hypothetical protein CONLIGDRAFT_405125 [Coniochaeta ligniaria NRRL 30616]|uniref:Uncharacterized protein n=1 Tax=Coniochaeta ligniaria NRRL 30616 TaxID=1408157 RepID=A0A1J7J6V7_9PEZI|nr:hypothetical protein CONLIGDRAFT_405125 [Coniochaeta ligniaria NRRL 30616]